MNLKDRMIVEEYRRERHDFIRLGDIASSALKQQLESAKIDTLAVEHRVKKEESLAGKLERKSDKYSSLTPYVPGEQPKDMRYIKLNTNESPFPPSVMALEKAAEAAKRLMLYSDPECTELTRVASQRLGVEPEEILFTNG